MYNILIVLDSWIIFNTKTQAKKTLTAAQENVLKELFSDLLEEHKVLHAIQVTTVNPSKLQLSADIKKQTDLTKKAASPASGQS